MFPHSGGAAARFTCSSPSLKEFSPQDKALGTAGNLPLLEAFKREKSMEN